MPFCSGLGNQEMVLDISVIDNFEENQHIYRALSFCDQQEGLQELAAEYHKLLTNNSSGAYRISLDGIGEWSTDDLRKLLNEDMIPSRGEGNFAVVRSDFGEVASYLILEQHFQTKIGYKLIRDRESQDLTGRGIDAVGIEYKKSKLALVLSETKVSSDKNNPPTIVEHGSDSIKGKLIEYSSDHERTRRKITNAANKTVDREIANLLFAAAELWGTKTWSKLNVIYCGILIRQRDSYDSNDFGSLRTNPGQINHGAIRFLILCVDGNIEDTVTKFHEIASRGGEDTN